tara:strand:+ start:203 stop:364 length:162 start_codon:yes stop_codon:yes gene_type:complete
VVVGVDIIVHHVHLVVNPVVQVAAEVVVAVLVVQVILPLQVLLKEVLELLVLV